MKKLFFVLCAAAATLVACNKAEVAAPVANDNARVVKFAAENLYEFETKAITGSVGIWAGDPINANNQSYTISGSSLTGSSILWGIEQAGTNNPSEFFAMYPYDSDASFTHGTGYAFTIRTDTGDHKTEDIAAAENFMVAATKAAPGTDETPAAVTFNFVHPFAKIVYKITNNSDDAIRCATIAGVYWNGTIDYSGSEVGPLAVAATYSGSATDGTEANKTWLNGGDLVEGKYVFHTITMPKSGLTPAITVYMHSGATYTFNISGTLTAEAGKVYTANIELTHVQTSSTLGRTVSSTFTETDWTDGEGPTIASGDNYSSSTAWPILKGVNFELVRAGGNIAANNWSTALPMTCVGTHLYRAVIKKTDAANIKFKAVIPGVTDSWYGKGTQTTDGDWQHYTGGDGDIEWGGDVDDLISIYFNDDTHEIYVRTGDFTRTF